MRGTTENVLMVSWLVLLLLGMTTTVMALESGSAQESTVQQSASATETQPSDPVRPIQTERIDQAGQEIGQRIEKIGGVASKHMGGWINQTLFAGISWLKLLICCALLLIVIVAERVLHLFIERRINDIPPLAGTISWLRMLLQATQKPARLFIWVYGAYAAFSPLFDHFRSADGGNIVQSIVKQAVDIGGTIALFWFLYLLVSLLDVRLKRWATESENTIDDMLAPLVAKTLRLFIAVIGAMMIIQNLTGVEIGPLIASLGIGGLAVAFAAKDSIANFFGTLTILFDKPFQVGERIVIDTYDGTVEDVGFRSTRIRTLAGHLVTIPNEKVVNTALENIGRRPNIRWLTQIGITYDTQAHKMEEAVAILRSILAEHEGMHPDLPPRVYFNGFNDWSLNITVVAWYHPPDWWSYQEWIQRMCLEILNGFNAADIDFAFPSRTLYIAGDTKRHLKVDVTSDSPINHSSGAAGLSDSF